MHAFGQLIAIAETEGFIIGINDEISDAFRTARAAIVAKDYESRDEAIADSYGEMVNYYSLNRS